jgi:hypothetical protein
LRRAAYEIAKWRVAIGKEVSSGKVYQVAAFHRARADVVLVLIVGLSRRAVVKRGGEVDTNPHSYACILDEATVINAEDAAVCAALAIFLLTTQEASATR